MTLFLFAKKNDKVDELSLNSKLAIFVSEYGFYRVHNHCFADLAGFLLQYFHFLQQNRTWGWKYNINLQCIKIYFVNNFKGGPNLFICALDMFLNRVFRQEQFSRFLWFLASLIKNVGTLRKCFLFYCKNKNVWGVGMYLKTVRLQKIPITSKPYDRFL